MVLLGRLFVDTAELTLVPVTTVLPGELVAGGVRVSSPSLSSWLQVLSISETSLMHHQCTLHIYMCVHVLVGKNIAYTCQIHFGCVILPFYCLSKHIYSGRHHIHVCTCTVYMYMYVHVWYEIYMYMYILCGGGVPVMRMWSHGWWRESLLHQTC